jgi:hypothetical protein
MLKSLMVIGMALFIFGCRQEIDQDMPEYSEGGTGGSNVDGYRGVLEELKPMFDLICSSQSSDYGFNCAAQIALEFTSLKGAYDKGNFSVDLSKLSSCLDEARATMSLDIRFFKDCGLFVPSKEAGDQCISSLDCQGNNMCIETDRCGEYICIESGATTDISLAQVGESCDSSYCVNSASCIYQNDRYVCVNNNDIFVIQEGESCDPYSDEQQCVLGSLCTREASRDDNGYICRAIAREGDICYLNDNDFLNSNCDSGFYCDGLGDGPSGICRAFPKEGENCGRTITEDADDVTDFCYLGDLLTCVQGVCKPISLENENCDTDESCLNFETQLQCVDSKCTPVNQCQ